VIVKNINDLASYELELLYKTLDFTGTIEEKNDKVVYFGICTEYKKIHQEYSKLAKKNLEALKRGIFILWYALTEPSCYTGIGILDLAAEKHILRILDRRLKEKITDYELEWMLDYYSNWDFVFESFKEFEYVQQRMKATEKTELPDRIDRNHMSTRGQMGRYWNSLNRFKK